MMRSIYKILILVLLTSAGACTKKTENTTQYGYGSIRLFTAALPNTPEMVIYVNGDSIVQMSVGTEYAFKAQTADKKELIIYKAGTNTILADTMIQFIKDSTIFLKYAYSDALDINGFLSGNTTTIHPDSCRFKLFNSLTTELQPEGVEVDAIIYSLDENGGYIETGLIFENFTRNKLHPMEAIIKAEGSYALRFRNRATGEFLTDWLGDKASITFDGGKYVIISAYTKIERTKPRLYTQSAEL